MSQGNNSSNDVQYFYEGDQSKLYSGLMSHHHGESLESVSSKSQKKRIWQVTGILSVITTVEVALGLLSHQWGVPKAIINTFFLILTLMKAGYIVRVFMHLGDELRNFFVTMMIPLTLFIWFIIAFLADGGFWLHMNKDVRAGMHTEQVQSDKVPVHAMDNAPAQPNNVTNGSK